jgi:hypothetical protein
MVAQLLAHIDALDTALQNLSDRIEYVLTPHAQIVEPPPRSLASRPTPPKS